MGTAAPFVESLEFVPMAPEAPSVDVEPVLSEVPVVAETTEDEVRTSVQSVVISLGQLAELSEAGGEGEEAWVESEEGQQVIAEIEARSVVAGKEIADRIAELDFARLIEEARHLQQMAEPHAEEQEERVRERDLQIDREGSRVLRVEPMEMGESEMTWRPNLMEQEEIDQMKAREIESHRLLGREFDSRVEQSGREIGRLRAQVSATKVLQQVLQQARRDEGEIPFAIDGDGNMYVAEEGDRERLEGLPLTGDAANGSMDLDDWVIVRLNDPESDLLAELRRTAGRNFAAGLGLVALALVGVAPLSKRITRDLLTLTDGAEQLATGDLSVRVPVRSRDEVGHLARTFNQMAEDLQQNQQQLVEQERLRKEHEIERRLLEAENTRRGEELEDARLFQLSLLPKELPKHPRLEIGVFMRTATEVGGDYYDFHLGADGTLTAAVGDATGHGARAGTMVTVIKSLFTAEAGKAGLSEFLEKASQSIRRMELGRMAMALTLIRIENDLLKVAAAGMPPMLIRRASDQGIEELAVEGVPLGSMSQYHYRERQVRLHSGDTLLMMSDGFPELTNENGEPMGYPAVQDLFAEGEAEAPETLIARLAEAAERWSGGASPSDDITFVVLKVRS
jgi:serine phosphatase RsbU (regulator of sigma subunit)